MPDLQSSLRDVTESIDSFTKDDSTEQREKTLRAIDKLRNDALPGKDFFP
jgi:hypothetical protein